MISNALFGQMLALLGSDSTGLGSTANSPVVHLIREPFAPEDQLPLADLVEADFDGYAARSTAAGAKPQSLDPVNGDSLLDLPADPDPYLWEVTGTTNLPQTIYGYMVDNPLTDAPYQWQLLPTPIVLSAVNQSLSLPRVYLRQLAGSVD